MVCQEPPPPFPGPFQDRPLDFTGSLDPFITWKGLFVITQETVQPGYWIKV